MAARFGQRRLATRLVSRRLADTSGSYTASAATGVAGLASAKKAVNGDGSTQAGRSGQIGGLAAVLAVGALGWAYHEGLWWPLLRDGECAAAAAAGLARSRPVLAAEVSQRFGSGGVPAYLATALFERVTVQDTICDPPIPLVWTIN